MANTGYISDLVTWFTMSENAVVSNNNGTIQKTFKFSAKDTTTFTEDNGVHYFEAVNNVLKRLKKGYILHWEMAKHHDEDYIQTTNANALQAKFDETRKDRLQPNLYRIEYYLTIIYRQPTQTTAKLSNIFYDSDETVIQTIKSIWSDFWSSLNPKSVKDSETFNKLVKDYSELMKDQEIEFLDEIAMLIGMFHSIFDEIKPLSKEETITYLHSTISATPHKQSGDIDSYIIQQISDSEIVGGREPKLGHKYISTIGIKGLPEEIPTDVFDALRYLPSEFRYSVRYIALSKSEAIKEANSIADGNWFTSKKATAQLAEITNQNSGNDNPTQVDRISQSNAEDAVEAVELIERDAIGLGYLTVSLVLLNEDKKQLETDTKLCLEIFSHKNFNPFVEKSQALKAWLGTIPSCYQSNVRKFLTTSETLTAFAPITSMWEGQSYNEHLDGPPLLKCTTQESLPFNLSLHVEDVGHTLIVGSTGSGKSVLLNTISAHFMKYPNSRIYTFDIGASSLVTTLAMGGNHYNLLEDTKSISFKPLAEIHDHSEVEWVLEWLSTYAKSIGEEVTNVDKRDLEKALIESRYIDDRDKTLSILRRRVQNEMWRRVLHNLTIADVGESQLQQGLYGNLFDANEDKLGQGRWQVFEMERLLQNPTIAGTVVDYLFHRIQRKLSSEFNLAVEELKKQGYSEKDAQANAKIPPTMIVLDECWAFLNHAEFLSRIISYIRTLRKFNASVIMATQNLDDFTPDIVPLLSNNMQTKIFLANPTMNDVSRELYERFGLNPTEIEIVANLEAKEDYFYKSQLGSRIFRLGLREEYDKKSYEGAFVTATSVKDQNTAKEFFKSVSSTDEFIDKWLKYQGVS
jgi:cagE, trbE, virB component of type IV transporter system, conserved region